MYIRVMSKYHRVYIRSTCHTYGFDFFFQKPQWGVHVIRSKISTFASQLFVRVVSFPGACPKIYCTCQCILAIVPKAVTQSRHKDVCTVTECVYLYRTRGYSPMHSIRRLWLCQVILALIVYTKEYAVVSCHSRWPAFRVAHTVFPFSSAISLPQHGINGLFNYATVST